MRPARSVVTLGTPWKPHANARPTACACPNPAIRNYGFCAAATRPRPRATKPGTRPGYWPTFSPGIPCPRACASSTPAAARGWLRLGAGGHFLRPRLWGNGHCRRYRPTGLPLSGAARRAQRANRADAASSLRRHTRRIARPPGSTHRRRHLLPPEYGRARPPTRRPRPGRRRTPPALDPGRPSFKNLCTLTASAHSQSWQISEPLIDWPGKRPLITGQLLLAGDFSPSPA